MMKETYETKVSFGMVIIAIIDLMMLIGWFSLIVIGVGPLSLDIKIVTLTMTCIFYILLFLLRICSMYGIGAAWPLPVRMIIVIATIVCFLMPMTTVTPVLAEKATYQLETMTTELIQMENEWEAQKE